MEELEIQRVMIEEILEKQIQLEARLSAMSEILIVNNIFDEETLTALEEAHYHELIAEALEP